MTQTMATNEQVVSLAHSLAVERYLAVQLVAYRNSELDDTSLQAAYVDTDRRLAAVRSQSAWPSRRPGEPVYLASVEAFTAALHDIRNRTVTSLQSLEHDAPLAPLFTFYADVNEYLLLSVAMTTQVLASLLAVY